jgi:hypothetical protein
MQPDFGELMLASAADVKRYQLSNLLLPIII